MKTALQQAIEKTLQQYDSLNVWTQFNEGYAYGLQAAISILTEHLPIERNQIIVSYSVGHFKCQREIECSSKCDMQCTHCQDYYETIEKDSATDYYNQTFLTDKNETDAQISNP